MSNPQIQQLVSNFVDDLTAVFQRSALEAVQASLGASLGALGGGSTPAAARIVQKRPGRPAKAAKPAPAFVATPKKAAPQKAALPKAPAPKQAAPKAASQKGGKRIRRSPAEIDAMVGRIVSYVGTHNGERSEIVRSALKIDKQQWLTAIRRSIETQQITTKGQKRTTQLFTVGGRAAATPRNEAPKAEAPKAEPVFGRAVPPIKRVRKA